jgi:hypothetical protein
VVGGQGVEVGFGQRGRGLVRQGRSEVSVEGRIEEGLAAAVFATFAAAPLPVLGRLGRRRGGATAVVVVAPPLDLGGRVPRAVDPHRVLDGFPPRADPRHDPLE